MSSEPADPPLRHMNVFMPYERRAHHHEDNLTRAFLLVLRGVPVAHAAWLDLVDQAHRANGGAGVPRLHALAAPRIVTQTGSVPEGVRRIISLVQSDETFVDEADAEVSQRRQVLDGVVSYDEFALVIENKPSHRNIRRDQLRVNVPAGVTHDTKVAGIAWRDIVLAWGRLLEAGHLGPAETVLLGDFLDFVETFHSTLRPFSKVGLCSRDVDRLERRCAELLKQLASNDYRHHRGWGPTIRLGAGQCALMAGFFPRTRARDVDLVVEYDPGDTTAQARLLYGSADAAAVLGLRERGWQLTPNFHLAHMTTNLVYTTVRLTVEGYWELCAGAPTWLRVWRRGEHEQLFDLLLAEKLAEAANREHFDRHITRTNRDKINVCPGLIVQWRMPIDEAALLDARGQLETRVRAALLEGAAALGLRLPIE
jgi:hypothetical protein